MEENILKSAQNAEDTTGQLQINVTANRSD